MRLLPSLSPSEREVHKESISSTNTTDGFFSRAISNTLRTKRSLSPCHFDTYVIVYVLCMYLCIFVGECGT